MVGKAKLLEVLARHGGEILNEWAMQTRAGANTCYFVRFLDSAAAIHIVDVDAGDGMWRAVGSYRRMVDWFAWAFAVADVEGLEKLIEDYKARYADVEAA